MSWRVIAVAMVCVAAAASGAEKVLDFRDCKTNEPPPGFRSTLSGTGQPGDWRILLDAAPSAFPPLSPRSPVDLRRPVLAQLSRDATDEHFPLLIYEDLNLQEFSLSTQFK